MTDNAVAVVLDEPVWSQRPDENDRWHSRFVAYLQQGPTRSVRSVYALERAESGKALAKSQSVPASWAEAYKAYDWLNRAKAYDAHRRAEIFRKGNASDEKRIAKLDEMIDKLFEKGMAGLALYVPEEGFPDKLFDKMLSAMDLMAKHTGGYVERVELKAKHEITGKDGGPVQTENTVKVMFYMPDVDPMPTQGNETTIEAIEGEVSVSEVTPS